jgi:hypothetical protein
MTPPGANTNSAAPALKKAYQTASRKKKKDPNAVDQGAVRMMQRKVAGGPPAGPGQY